MPLTAADKAAIRGIVRDVVQTELGGTNAKIYATTRAIEAVGVRVEHAIRQLGPGAGIHLSLRAIKDRLDLPVGRGDTD